MHDADLPLSHSTRGARQGSPNGLERRPVRRELALTGEETTPERVVGADGAQVEILTGGMEHHISADVAYAVWQYWVPLAMTRSSRAGAEILLETARFWASRAVPEANEGGISAT